MHVKSVICAVDSRSTEEISSSVISASFYHWNIDSIKLCGDVVDRDRVHTKMSNRPEPSRDEREAAQSKSPNLDLLYDRAAEAIVGPVGSVAYSRLQASLGIIEKTARWSLPRKYAKDALSGPPLERPLPWILFLPALLALRLIRCTMSVILLMFGQPPVDPTTMVNFLQLKRKKLRDLRTHGTKLQRKYAEQAQKKAEQQQPDTWMKRVAQLLRNLFCFSAVRPGTTINRRDAQHRRHRNQRPTVEPASLPDALAADESRRGEPEEQSSSKKRGRDAEDSSQSSALPEASGQEEVDKFDSAEDNSCHPSDDSSTDFVSNDSDSDNSKTETVINAERDKPKKIKKDINGHATSDEKKPQKSSLNVAVVENSDKPEEKPSAENGKEVEQNGVLTEQVSENGVVASENEPMEEKPAETPQKPVNGAEEIESTVNKPNNQSSPDKEQPPEKDDSAKEDNQDSSGKQSPDSIKGVKANSQQKKKQQKQHTAANGGNGGRKQKKSPN